LGSQDNTAHDTNDINMLSAAIKRQYSSVLPLLRHCLPVFDKTLLNGNEFCIFIDRVTLIKIANTPADRSSALVLSLII